MPEQPTRSAIQFDIFAGAARKSRLGSLGAPLQRIFRHLDFECLMPIVDALLPKADGGAALFQVPWAGSCCATNGRWMCLGGRSSPA